MPDELIRIKRYPNRRFYASHSSSYVSLAEIERFIRKGSTVEITDSQTGRDITRAVLVQIIADRHPEKMAIFPTAMLHSMLRANDLMTDFLRDYFRNSLAYLNYFQAHGGSVSSNRPMHWMKAWMEDWPGATDANAAPDSEMPSPPSGARELAERIIQLELRIAELEVERTKRK